MSASYWRHLTEFSNGNLNKHFLKDSHDYFCFWLCVKNDKTYFSGALILRIFAITPSYDLNFFQHINHLKIQIFFCCATPLGQFEEKQNRFCHGITFLNMNSRAQSWNLQVADFLLRIFSYFVHCLLSNEFEWMIILEI